MTDLSKITPPENYTLTQDGDTLLLKGPYCKDLAKRLYRLKAYWDGEARKNRKCWVIPIGEAKSLNRIFTNWEKANDKRLIADMEQWIGYVEEAAAKAQWRHNCNAKLREMGIARYPELNERFEAAIKLAKENMRKQREEKVEFKPSYGKSWNIGKKREICVKCGQYTSPGDEVHYLYVEDGLRRLVHVDCEQAKYDREKKQAEAPYRVYGGSGYGYVGWKEKSVISTPQMVREKHGEDCPDFLFVVESGADYYPEDGMSFGVGDENGYVYWARCRAATDDESHSLRKVIAARKKVADAKSEYRKITDHITKTGEYPEGMHRLEGERIFDTANIYGTGEWIVIEKEWIWYVKNNGMDGDNWSHNNVKTWGAGGIGRRIAFDQEIADKLYELRKIIKDAEIIFNLHG